MRLKVLGILGMVLMTSCSVEKAGISPTTNLVAVQDNASKNTNFGKNIEWARYASEITNAFETIRPFSEKEMNDGVSELKFYTSEYLYAIQEHNMVGREKAYYKYEQVYKKLQKNKRKLNEEEQEILNRFLVNIKTNMSLIETTKDKP